MVCAGKAGWGPKYKKISICVKGGRGACCEGLEKKLQVLMGMAGGYPDTNLVKSICWKRRLGSGVEENTSVVGLCGWRQKR